MRVGSVEAPGPAASQLRSTKTYWLAFTGLEPCEYKMPENIINRC